MAQHSIEEAFRTIAPSRRRGIPNAPTVATGVSGSGGDLSKSLSQAGTEIAQLRATYQQQVDLIKANTQAVQSNTAGQGSHSTAGSIGNAVSGLFGGALGLLSPIISGIMHLFGGGSTQATVLPVYTPPPPVSIGGILHSGADTQTPQASPAAGTPQAGVANASQPAVMPSQTSTTPQAGASTPASQNQTTNSVSYSPQITVHVNAMDSQSFMDRSGDIANAVREAMLNNHPINGVVADL